MTGGATGDGAAPAAGLGGPGGFGRGGERAGAEGTGDIAGEDSGTGGMAGDDPPSAMGNENALIEGCAGAGPRIDSRSAGLRVTPPAFSMARCV